MIRLHRIHWKGSAFSKHRDQGLHCILDAGGAVVAVPTRVRHLYSWEVIW